MAGPRSLLPLWLMLPAILLPLHPSHPLNQTLPPTPFRVSREAYFFYICHIFVIFATNMGKPKQNER